MSFSETLSFNGFHQGKKAAIGGRIKVDRCENMYNLYGVNRNAFQDLDSTMQAC